MLMELWLQYNNLPFYLTQPPLSTGLYISGWSLKNYHPAMTISAHQTKPFLTSLMEPQPSGTTGASKPTTTGTPLASTGQRTRPLRSGCWFSQTHVCPASGGVGEPVTLPVNQGGLCAMTL